MKRAGLSKLSHAQHAQGEEEIRLWMGLSIAIPQEAIRLVNRNGNVSGEMIYYWEFRGGDSLWANYRAELRANVSQWCMRARFTGDMWTCRARFDPEPNWNALWSQLKEQGVFEPHDPSLTKTPFYVQTDGFFFDIETWDGHAYHEWTPEPGMSQRELDRGREPFNFFSSLAGTAVRSR